MKTPSIFITLLIVLLIYGFTGCEKNASPALPAGCYKATLIAFDCNFIVQVEGGPIGEQWHGKENCVSVTNLPSDARQIGSTLYFTAYRSASGLPCTADKTYDFPFKIIELLNYSKTDCPKP